MFKIISKRKYEALKNGAEKWRKDIEELFDNRSKEIDAREAWCRQIEDDLNDLQGILNVVHKKSDENKRNCDKYKTLYADELQKRLDLAAKVRDVETHNEELQEKLFRTEKDLSEVKASISAKERAVQVTTAGNIIRMLELGVVEDAFAGTFCKDVDVIIKHIRKRFIS